MDDAGCDVNALTPDRRAALAALRLAPSFAQQAALLDLARAEGAASPAVAGLAAAVLAAARNLEAARRALAAVEG